MTTTTPDAGELIDLDIDLTQEVACMYDDCPNPATWHGTMRHTGEGTVCDGGPICEPHRQANLLKLELHRIFFGGSKCTDHHRGVYITWRPL